jgi:CBS domain-containing protein
MTVVGDVMTTKVVSVRPDTRFERLIEVMLDHDVSGLPVIDEQDRVVGVVTEADLVARQRFHVASPRLLSVVDDALHARHNTWRLKAAGLIAGDIMSAPACTIRATDDAGRAAAVMITMGHKRLPVVDDAGRLIGIVAQRDILRLLHDRLIASEAGPEPASRCSTDGSMPTVR